MKSTPNLNRVHVICPEAPRPPDYPFDCTFTARDRERRGAAVTGTIAVIGVYAPTRTYAFELTYAGRKKSAERR